MRTPRSHIVHWDEVEKKKRTAGEISGTWTFLGQEAGTVGPNVGASGGDVQRVYVPPITHFRTYRINL